MRIASLIETKGKFKRWGELKWERELHCSDVFSIPFKQDHQVKIFHWGKCGNRLILDGVATFYIKPSCILCTSTMEGFCMKWLPLTRVQHLHQNFIQPGPFSHLQQRKLQTREPENSRAFALSLLDRNT